MELALSMWSLHRTVAAERWSVLDFLAFCRDEGITAVELLDVFWKDPVTELEEAIAFANQFHIKPVSYAVTNNFADPDPEKREEALERILLGIPVARKLGTPVIRVFAGDLHPEVNEDDAFAWIIAGLSQAAKKAEKAGCLLCLENHGKLAGRGSQIKKIIETVNSPALRSTLDVGNFLLVDEDPLEEARKILPYVAHVHVKDFKATNGGPYRSLNGVEYEGVCAGEGDVRLGEILTLLQESGYQGAYVLEYEGPGSEREGILRSYQNFRALTESRKMG